MTMFYDNRDLRFLAAQAHQREVDAQKKIVEDNERRRRAAGLSKKAIPLNKFGARDA